MNNRNDENLKELLDRFFNHEQSQMYLDDIEKGEQILRENPAPEPDDMLIANIKAQIALGALPRKTSIIKRIEYKVAAVAAALVIITAISTSWFEKSVDVEPMPGIQIASVFPWESSDIDALQKEVEQIEDELINLDSGGEKLDNNNDVTEMEMELILIAGDFWKG